MITVAPSWMMPDLATAMSWIVSPNHSVWSSPIGVTTQTGECSTLVASSAPPRPTSTTATSTGASANAASAIAVVISKYVSACALSRSTSSASGAISWYAATNRSSSTGSPSRLIRSRTVSRCGLVNRPVCRPNARSSESIIRAVDVLPLVPGQVDRRVRPLRAAEEIQQSLDAPEVELHPGVAARQQFGVDLRELAPLQSGRQRLDRGGDARQIGLGGGEPILDLPDHAPRAPCRRRPRCRAWRGTARSPSRRRRGPSSSRARSAATSIDAASVERHAHLTGDRQRGGRGEVRPGLVEPDQRPDQRLVRVPGRRRRARQPRGHPLAGLEALVGAEPPHLGDDPLQRGQLGLGGVVHVRLSAPPATRP